MKHPITPPSKLLQEWMFELHFQVPHPDYGPMNPQPHWEELIERVAQWAADQELESCCEWLADAKNHGFGYDHGKLLSNKLRAALAQPATEPPAPVDTNHLNDEQFNALAPQGYHGVGDCQPQEPTDEELLKTYQRAVSAKVERIIQSTGTYQGTIDEHTAVTLAGLHAVLALFSRHQQVATNFLHQNDKSII